MKRSTASRAFYCVCSEFGRLGIGVREVGSWKLGDGRDRDRDRDKLKVGRGRGRGFVIKI